MARADCTACRYPALHRTIPQVEGTSRGYTMPERAGNAHRCGVFDSRGATGLRGWARNTGFGCSAVGGRLPGCRGFGPAGSRPTPPSVQCVVALKDSCLSDFGGHIAAPIGRKKKPVIDPSRVVEPRAARRCGCDHLRDDVQAPPVELGPAAAIFRIAPFVGPKLSGSVACCGVRGCRDNP